MEQLAANNQPRLYDQARRRRRQWMDKLFVIFCITAAFVSLVVLAVLLIAIGYQGFEYVSLDFLKNAHSRNPEDAGISPAFWGSVAICTVCAVTAVPVGVATAILIEEFKPKTRWLSRLHGFIQLNIANLAGVPSIVYGLLGLTAFVGMFGLFGHSNEPAFTIGATFYDVFYDEAGYQLQVEVEGNADPTELSDGMTLLDAETGEAVTVNLVEQPFTGAAKKGDLRVGEYAQRLDKKRPWYLQLPFGRGVLATGLTLMLVVLPVIIISSQEALRAVPNTLRQGALAMGCTRWQMVWKMTLPCAIPGIMTGTILAISRAVGEAAPILIVTGIVFITFTPEHLMDDVTAMPLQIFQWAGEPRAEFHQVAAAGIIVLLSLLLSFNAIAVFIRYKFQRPLS